MKKSFIAFVSMIAFSATAYAAQIVWGAINLDAEFSGGTAYLVQMTTGSHTIADIASYISTNGTSHTSTDFKHWTNSTSSLGDGTISEISGYYMALNITAADTITTTSNLSNFFVVAINGDKFALSSMMDGSIAGDGANWNPNFGATDTWTTGTIGGGDTPGVPEPTAFALLALGVAGLALRRKHA